MKTILIITVSIIALLALAFVGLVFAVNVIASKIEQYENDHNYGYNNKNNNV